MTKFPLNTKTLIHVVTYVKIQILPLPLVLRNAWILFAQFTDNEISKNHNSLYLPNEIKKE